MKENKNIEELIGQKLSERKVEIQQNWLDDMSERLDAFNKTRRRKIFIFWFFLCSTLIGGTALSLLLIFNTGESGDHNADRLSQVKESKQVTKSTKKEEDQQQVAAANDTVLLNENSLDATISESDTEALNSERNRKQENHSILNVKSEKDGAISREENNLRNGREKSPTSSSSSLSGDGRLIISENSNEIDFANEYSSSLESNNSPHVLIGERKITGQNEVDSSISSSSSSSSSVSLNPVSNHNSDTGQLINSIDSNTTEVVSEDGSNTNLKHNSDVSNAQERSIDTAKVDSSTNPSESQLSDITSNEIEIVSEGAAPTDTNDIFESHEITPPSLALNNKERKWSFGIFAGPNYSFSTIKSESASPYFDQREVQENGIVGWNVGMRLSRKIGNFNLSSGAEISTIREKVSYESVKIQTVENTEIYTDNSYYDYDSIFQAGQWYIIDSTHIIDIDTSNQTTTIISEDSSVLAANGINSFQYLHIPLNFGFPIIRGNKFSLNGFLGTSVGVLVNNKGRYLNEGGGVIVASSKRFTFNSVYGLQGQYPITKRLTFNAEAYFRIDHTNHSPLNGIRRKYYSTGLNVGCTFSF